MLNIRNTIGWLLATLLILFYSCRIIVGYDKVNKVNIKWINNLIGEYKNTDITPIYLSLEDATFLNSINCSFNSTIQPMQFHHVIGDSVIYSYFNCYARGLRRLNWTFQKNEKLYDCKQAYNGFLLTEANGYKFIVVVSSMFKIQSEDLLNKVIRTYNPERLMLINIDGYYVDIFNGELGIDF